MVFALLFVLILVGVLGAFQILGSGGTLTELWVSDTARNYQANHHPVAAERTDAGVLIVAPLNEIGDDVELTETSCSLARLNATTGAVMWRAGVPPANCTNHALPSPTIADVNDDGTAEVLIVRGDRTLTVHSAVTGAEVWRHSTSELGYSRPAVADLLSAPGREIVVVDLSGHLFMIRADGSTAWDRELGSTVWADPAVDDFDGDGASEIAVATGESVFLLEPDGEQVWRTNVSSLWMATGQADADTAPELFIADNVDNTVYALDGGAGEIQWSRTFDGTPALHAVGDGDADDTPEVYVGASGGTLIALNATDGVTEWTTRLPGAEQRITPPPALGDIDGDEASELVAGTSEGVVVVVDPATGEQVATYEREVPIKTNPTLVDIDGDGDDEILVIYGDGRVVALSFETG
ncbi:PQQ-binding-like beta-propeller repeat protein [Halomarina halobia]|uniref:outer membrane protein assembly factor BamB family protein n=1 Tax=Halomarina halobia TaxID=3033386 RepID=UPI0036D25CAE